MALPIKKLETLKAVESLGVCIEYSADWKATLEKAESVLKNLQRLKPEDKLKLIAAISKDG